MFSIIAKSLKTGSPDRGATLRSATRRSDFRSIDFSRCMACDECARSCPTGAIQTADAAARAEDAVAVVACVHPVPRVRERMSRAGRQRLARGRDAAYTPRAARAHRIVRRRSGDGPWHVRAELRRMPGLSLHESAGRLRERIRGRLGRSLHVRQVDAGSCNGCELEIAATTNPLYDLERFGVHLVASPRHADLLLVTGPVTRNMEIALRRTYDAAPEPRSWWRSGRVDAAAEFSARPRMRLSGASIVFCPWTSTFPAVRRVPGDH